MNAIKVLSLDPSQRNLGMAKVLIDPVTLSISVEDLKLITTEKGTTKQVRKNSDDLSRARHEWTEMAPWLAWADMVASEIPTGSQNASAMFSNGVCVGLLAAIEKPLIQVQPTETKMASVGRKTATKDEVVLWATTLYPDAPWIRDRGKPNGRIVAANEHLGDALGVAHAAIKTAEFRSAISMLQSFRRAA